MGFPRSIEISSRAGRSASEGGGHPLRTSPDPAKSQVTAAHPWLRTTAWPPAGAIATRSVVAEVTVCVLTATGVW